MFNAIFAPKTFMMKLSAINSQILAIAIPSIISNITVPLLGLVDITIVGHLGSASYIAAIALGGTLFNVIYWIFGFLRMGTGGLTSQAYGRRDDSDISGLIVRSLAVAVFISAAILLLHPFIFDFAFGFMFSADTVVENYARQYLDICIWGVPAVLGSYSFAGWFIGMQNSRIPMFVAIAQNLVNIASSLGFVFGLGMKVEGVALGTLVAQYAGLLMSFVAWRMYYPSCYRAWRRVRIADSAALKRFFMVNKDIFLRTLCLVAVTLFFTSAGARQGEEILAVNALMMQFFTLFSYVMDGFAYSAEALSGKFLGAGDMVMLRRTVRTLFGWGVAMSLLFVLLYWTGGDLILGIMTDNSSVIALTSDYFHWVLLIPLAGFAAFVWDGVYIGVTATAGMLLSMVVAMLTFFALYYMFFGKYGNDALWVSFISYLAVRGLVQMMLAGKAVYKQQPGHSA